MAQPKTTRTDADVDAFLASVADVTRRRDAIAMRDLMTRVTGEQPAMWGPSIVGFGPYTYRPKSGGAEHEWFKVGFSPRKTALTLYVMDGFDDYETLLGRLGKHTTGKACLYIKNLDDVDEAVLIELLERSVKAVESRISGSD
jgi:hypothetical protein